MFVCVCVCERENERELGWDDGGEEGREGGGDKNDFIPTTVIALHNQNLLTCKYRVLIGKNK